MSRFAWFFAGCVFLIVLLAIGVAAFIQTASGFSARVPPSKLESFLAHRFRSQAMPADRNNPVPDTPEVLDQARAHWADHCAVCHANNGSGNTEMGRHMYPPAPDMRLGETQHLSDGELFFIIENGVRFTGMPGWGGPGRDEQDSWKLVRFIRHLPHMTPQEERTMEKMNPKSPDELKEEQEETEFLNGGPIHEPAAPHHHH